MSRHPLTRPLSRLVDAALEATVVGSFTKLGPLVRSHLPGWAATPPRPLAGRTAVVTGATSGLGRAMAVQLGALGARLHVVGRNPAALDEIVAQLGADGVVVERHQCDLASLSEVRALADALEGPVDVLAHNAGVMVDSRQDTVDGTEITAQVHVVAPFLLTTLLLDRLRASDDGRVITMASGGMYTQRLDVTTLFSPPEPFDGTTQYARAKRAQVELNAMWADRHPDAGVGFHAMHPGWADTPGIRTALPRFHQLLGPVLRTADEGAETATWLAWTPEATAPGGDFWLDRRRRRTISWPGTDAPSGERDRMWAEVARRAGVDA